ncbi:MAG TPA: gluconolaconase, partial [Blastocatellia bacterium]|nr:gluconolaconase [Blastocatellia bacterium]
MGYRKILLALTILLLPSAATLLLYYALRQENIPTSRNAIGQVTIYAGTGEPGFADGPATSAKFADPFGVAVDRRGNVIIADGGSANRIRRITPAGQVETIAGSVEGFRDGRGDVAEFNTPSGLAVDGSGDIIIADTANNRIRQLDTRGLVSTLAGNGERGFRDGPASEAQFDGPIGVAVDREGNIFVADAYNDRIRKISRDGYVSTLAGAGTPGYGDGFADAALFDTPCGVAVDDKGNVFVADTGNDAIRKITPQGEVTTITGNIPEAEIRLDRPIGIVVTHDGFLFVAEEGRGRISRITPEG